MVLVVFISFVALLSLHSFQFMLPCLAWRSFQF
jgi:hypothetical protein